MAGKQGGVSGSFYLPLVVALLGWVPSGTVAAAPAGSGRTLSELVDLSLEELGNLQVTSVSLREESLSGAAASIFVITGDDIRRSGATSLPEALRMAPNLNVARADANNYAISARGFNDTLANKLLVTIDGRVVYSPFHSGVLWEAQDVFLEDIERIEVISGPGATLHGMNAVNGLISIITRSSAQTQGTVASGHLGNRDRGVGARYGAKLANGGGFRLYAKTLDRSDSERADGSSVVDGSRRSQAGFRTDWGTGTDRFTVQGDAYTSDIDQLPSRRSVSGANLLARWNRALAATSDVEVLAYYDRTNRRQPDVVGVFRDRLDTFALEARHALRPAERHQVVYGAGYRQARDKVGNSAYLGFFPQRKTLEWYHLFAQDEIALRRDVSLTVGAKVEHNVYTGAELLPNLRLAWRFAPGHHVWGSVARAVRAPARIERDFYSPTADPVIRGGPHFEAEVSNVFEIGYRGQLAPSLTLSATVFLHDHERLRSLEPGPEGGLVFENGVTGHTTGLETWATWQVTRGWRVYGGLTLLDQDLRLRPGVQDPVGLRAHGNDPSHWWKLRSLWNVTPRHTFDVTVRRVGALPDPRVPAYTAFAARVGWQVSRELSLALVAENLFDPRHPEWGPAENRVEHERSVFLQLVWRP